MSEATYFILAALLDGPLHGYAVIKRAQEQSGGRVNLAVGTLYGALDRMTDEGLIEVDREEVVAGRSRRYFQVTDSGRGAVQEEAGRLAAAAAVVTERTVTQRTVTQRTGTPKRAARGTRPAVAGGGAVIA
ncbi:PadR family transcriptional regulator PadR [Streptacidiphilus sp. MAP12-16]|uniref:PadR family transcriptional regulator n=1 Tax=Streptacidiphilus sp. MAP12-16 TaxID=3156300 RepID=UPI00351857F7